MFCFLTFVFSINPSLADAQTSKKSKFRIVEGSGDQPRRTYQDLFVEIEGREYLITNEYLQVHPFKTINQIIDLDGDGNEEVILEIAHGGNCCGPTFVVISSRDKYFYSIARHSSLDGALFPKIKVIEENNRLLLQSMTISNVQNMENKITLLEFTYGGLIEISSVNNGLLLSAIVEINASDFQAPKFDPIITNIDLDGDRASDKLTCRLWLRWDEVICEVNSTKVGNVELLSSCDRVGVLETSRMGMKDLVCGRSKVMSYNGSAYE